MERNHDHRLLQATGRNFPRSRLHGPTPVGFLVACGVAIAAAILGVVHPLGIPAAAI